MTRPGLPAPGLLGPDALSITEFYGRVDRALRSAFSDALWVTGEIRTIKVLAKGHCFIDLVDPTHARDSGAPTLNVKCWSTQWRSIRGTLDRLGITLEAGMVVRARGQAQLYKPRGTVDFILSDLDTDALLGKVAAERARLVKALVDEELFDRQRRLPFAVLPLRVGLVASPGTEGFHDFIGGLRSSGMAFEVTLAPATVQGKGAPSKVAAAISNLRSRPLDVIVLVRGGGSKADLAAFDHERVARAIATSDIPVWTGIGHTGDLSVADEVANRSFITPTECGQELARMATDFWRQVEDAGALVSRMAREQILGADRLLASRQRAAVTGARSQLDRHHDRVVHRTHALRSSVKSQVDGHGHRLVAKGSALSRSAVRAVDAGEAGLHTRSRRLAALPDRRLQAEGQRVEQWQRLLGAYDYQRQLERGYSVTRDAGGQVIRSASDLDKGTMLYTELAEGQVVSEVTATGDRRTAVSRDEGRGSPDDRHDDEGKR
jgi:exodeoxyribonuclease VII large subunit